jgi:hypothetical protein
MSIIKATGRVTALTVVIGATGVLGAGMAHAEDEPKPIITIGGVTLPPTPTIEITVGELDGDALPLDGLVPGVTLPDLDGGLPVPDLGGGLPVPDLGGGLPIPDLGGGLPVPDLGGGLPIPDLGGGLPIPDLGGGVPELPLDPAALAAALDPVLTALQAVLDAAGLGWLLDQVPALP